MYKHAVKLHRVSREQTVFLVTNHSLPLGRVTRLCSEREGSTGGEVFLPKRQPSLQAAVGKPQQDARLAGGQDKTPL